MRPAQESSRTVQSPQLGINSGRASDQSGDGENTHFRAAGTKSRQADRQAEGNPRHRQANQTQKRAEAARPNKAKAAQQKTGEGSRGTGEGASTGGKKNTAEGENNKGQQAQTKHVYIERDKIDKQLTSRRTDHWGSGTNSKNRSSPGQLIRSLPIYLVEFASLGSAGNTIRLLNLTLGSLASCCFHWGRNLRSL